MRQLAMLGFGLLLVALARPAEAQPDSLNAIARDYVRLQLEIGARDDGYIDAYYGPPQVREEVSAHPRGLEELAGAVTAMQARVAAISLPPDTLAARRQRFLLAQLRAASTRLRMLRGERLSFAEEALGLYGIDLEGLLHPLPSYDPVLARIERLVPGEGPLADRVEAFLDRFIVPRDRLEAVMHAGIVECRRRTVDHIPLPAREAFTLEFVTNQPWSGYNWYQGDYRSRIQVNTDLPVRLGRAVDLGCHEGYPGHHVYNMMLERNLSRERGWIEFTVYSLYSPQSFIAEGSANYGVELAFPGRSRLNFETRTLYPLAGLPASRAADYLALQAAIQELAGARFTIARDLLEGRIGRDEAVTLVQRYQLMSRARAVQSVDFMQRYRAYVINYGLGRDVVAAYAARAGRTQEARWAAMRALLSEPLLPVDLLPRRAQ